MPASNLAYSAEGDAGESCLISSCQHPILSDQRQILPILEGWKQRNLPRVSHAASVLAHSGGVDAARSCHSSSCLKSAAAEKAADSSLFDAASNLRFWRTLQERRLPRYAASILLFPDVGKKQKEDIPACSAAAHAAFRARIASWAAFWASGPVR